jgi:hypothetical protein
LQFKISEAVLSKMKKKHNVKEKDVFECFFNRTHSFLIDSREEHRTDPVTNWFIAKTDCGRTLKICFVSRDGNIEIKTAYAPSTPLAIDMYYKKAEEC